MKRAITALTLLCGGLLFINPITNTIFAQNTNNKPATELVESININTNTNKEKIVKPEENIANKNIVEPKVNSKVESKINSEIKKDKNDQIIENSKQEIIDKQQVEDKNTVEVIDKEQAKDKNTVEVIDVLNQEQAKELLEMYNKDVNYTFQGDENTFKVLSQKGLSGYVFFPDYDTDLGFFVDKNTASIYYFHPSGYLELAM